MSFTNNPLMDQDFLRQLDLYKHKNLSCKIIVLDWDEHPVQQIEGKVTTGSITVDGSSSVRRACNLSLIADINDKKDNSFDYLLKSKFKLYIGLNNDINDKYDNIIWFLQGTYICTSCQQSLNAQGYVLQLQGKDKMCLLNGEVGGTLNAAHDFGKIKVIHSDGTEEEEYATIKEIIKNAVHVYANEPYYNIIINDVDDCAVQLMAYAGGSNDNPLFVYSENESDTNYQWITRKNGNDLGELFYYVYKSSEYEDGLQLGDKTYSYTVIEDGKEKSYSKTVGEGQNKYLVKAVGYGDTIGYQLTELTYAGDLTESVGSSITAVFDKIVSQLGEFEYFYDLDGHFVFQRKPIYCNISWSNAVSSADNETYYDSLANISSLAYSFNDAKLIESYSVSPTLLNIRNDFSIWGEISTVSETTLPIHLRCAIDDKPRIYISPREIIYLSGEDLTEEEEKAKQAASSYTTKTVDWRELIYQMAYDYQLYQSKVDQYTKAQSPYYFSTVEEEDGVYTVTKEKKYYVLTNTTESTGTYYVYKNGKFCEVDSDSTTGYTDIYKLDDNKDSNLTNRLNLWAKVASSNYMAYYSDMLEFWRQLYDPEKTEEGNDWTSNNFWNPTYFKYSSSEQSVTFLHPELMLFWIDFLDTNSSLAPYKVANIGRRTRAVSDSTVTSIDYRETPTILILKEGETASSVDTNIGYKTKMSVPSNYADKFVISTIGKTAKEAMDAMIYENIYFGEKITLNVIPVYYLQPNTRIKIYNKDLGVDGDYILNSYTVQLQHSGMMQISASKINDKII